MFAMEEKILKLENYKEILGGVMGGVVLFLPFFFFNMVGCAHRNIGANHLILPLVSDLGCICQWKDFDIC